MPRVKCTRGNKEGSSRVQIQLALDLDGSYSLLLQHVIIIFVGNRFPRSTLRGILVTSVALYITVVDHCISNKLLIHYTISLLR